MLQGNEKHVTKRLQKNTPPSGGVLLEYTLMRNRRKRPYCGVRAAIWVAASRDMAAREREYAGSSLRDVRAAR